MYFLRNHHSVFHNSCTILYFHQQCIQVPISLHLYNISFLFLSFLFFLLCPFPPFVIANLMVVKWYFIMVLICISLMTNDVDHLFMCILPICIFLEKCLFKSFAHFKIVLFFVIVVGVLYIFWISISYHICNLQIYSPILWIIFNSIDKYPLHKSLKF